MPSFHREYLIDDDVYESGCLDFSGFSQEEIDKWWKIVREVFPDPEDEDA